MNSVLKRVFNFSTRPTLSTCIFINALLNGVQLYTRTTYTCTVFPYRRNIQAKHCFRFTAKSEWTWIISKHTQKHTVLFCHYSPIHCEYLHTACTAYSHKKGKIRIRTRMHSTVITRIQIIHDFFFRRCTSLCVLNKRPRFHAILNVTLKLSLMYGNMDSTMCLWMIQFHTNNTIQHIHSAQNEQLFMAQSIWHNQ